MNKAKLCFGLMVMVAVLAACGGTDTDDDKIVVVESFLSASNNQNWDEASEYLADDVVFETPTGETTGLDVWLKSVQADGGGNIRQDANKFSVDGMSARWEMIVSFSDLEFPAIGVAVVENGRI